jgi:hypothetical protein
MSTINDTVSSGDKPSEGAATASPVTIPEFNNFPYTVRKSVTIKPKRTTTVLPEINTLGNTAEFYIQKIGGAFAGHGSTLPLGRRALTREEEKAWFPIILGIAPTHQDWDKYLNNYWHDISVPVPLEGLELNCNLVIEHEGHVGTPANAVHYILYKYCLIYGDVANTVEDVNKSPKIRFYLWTKEEDVKLKLTKQQLTDAAFIARLKLDKTPQRAESIIIMFNKELPLNDGDKKLMLAELQDSEPAKFLEFANDENLQDKAFIQRCINAALLRRPLNSQMIMYKDEVIGNSFSEAIGWLNQAGNSVTKAELQNSLKISR